MRIHSSKLYKILIILLLVINIYSCSKEAETEIEVFYIPFDVATYSPITMENIELQSHINFIIGSESRTWKSIRKLIDNANKGKFNNKVVRVKIKYSDGNVIYIDQDGGINIINKKETMKLSNSELKRLEKIFKYLEIWTALKQKLT